MNMEEIRKQYPQYSDLSDERLLRGLHQKFYSDMPEEQFFSQISGFETRPEMTTGEKIAEGFNSFADGALFGFGDNINAAGDALFRGGLPGQDRSEAATWRDRYNENLKFYRGNADQFREEHPVAATAANLGGAVAAPLGAAKAGATLLKSGMSTGKAVGLGALEGAAYGAAHGAGSADGENVGQSALAGGAIGAGVGGATSGIVQALVNRGASRGAQKFATIDELEAAKSQAYQRVDDLGATYTPEAIDDLVSAIRDTAQAGRIHPQRHPRASSMLDDFEGLRGQPQSLTELDQMRQVVRRDVASVADAGESHFGRGMIGNIDEFVDAAGPQTVTSGNAPAAAEAIKQARQLNSQAMKHRAVTDAVETAELRAASSNSGANTGNAIRQNLRRVLEKSKKPGKGNLTDQERKLLTMAIRGSATQNFARGVGKKLGGALGAFASLGGVATTGNPLMLGVHALGKIGQNADEAMTRGNVNELLAQILQGGAPQQAAQSPGMVALQKALIGQMAGAQ